MKWFPSLMLVACASTLVMSAENCGQMTCAGYQKLIKDLNDQAKDKRDACVKSKDAKDRYYDQLFIIGTEGVCKATNECCTKEKDKNGKKCGECTACKKVEDCCKLDKNGKTECHF